MPDMVHVCYNSVIKHAKKHPVRLITKHNFNDFVFIPDYVMEKVLSSVISLTHFSDILRISLLYEHGGIWLDATVLVTRNIQLENFPFYTPNAALETDEISLHDFPFFNPPWRPENAAIPATRWTIFFLAVGAKHNILFHFLKTFYDSYWKKYNTIIDYFVLDYMIILAYKSIPEIKAMIDNVPKNNRNLYFIQGKLGQEFSDKQFSDCCAETSFHKLTWKDNFDSVTPNGRLTYYGYLLEKYLHGEKE